MLHLSEERDPNRLDDATAASGPSVPGASWRYSTEAGEEIRTELERISVDLDAGDSSLALAMLERLPKLAERKEVGRLLPSIPEAARRFVPLSSLHPALFAYSDGALAFTPDLSHIPFDLTPEKERLLEIGFSSGALNGIALEAYPSAAELERIARATAGRSWRGELQRLLALPAAEFLLEHFEGRGGTIADKADWFGLEESRALRTASRGGPPIWKLFQDGAAARGLDAATIFGRDGDRTPEYRELYSSIYEEVLQPQPLLRDVLGRAYLAFTNTARDVEPSTKLLNGEGVSLLEQGRNLLFLHMLRDEIDTVTPAEFFALTGAISDPKDLGSYPAMHTWERLAAITPGTGAANARSSTEAGRQGVRIGWGGVPGQPADCRARPVIR